MELYPLLTISAFKNESDCAHRLPLQVRIVYCLRSQDKP